MSVKVGEIWDTVPGSGLCVSPRRSGPPRRYGPQTGVSLDLLTHRYMIYLYMRCVCRCLSIKQHRAKCTNKCVSMIAVASVVNRMTSSEWWWYFMTSRGISRVWIFHAPIGIFSFPCNAWWRHDMERLQALPLVWGIRWSLGDSSHKGSFILNMFTFSLLFAWSSCKDNRNVMPVISDTNGAMWRHWDG